MKIFLLNPPYLPAFIRSGRWTVQSISGSNWYPIWLGYCTGLLEKHNHDVKLLDALVDGLSASDTLGRISDFNPEITVIYTCTESLDNDVQLAEQIKDATKSFIVFVGPWCSVVPEEIINRSEKIDALAVGEFDYTILELAQGKSKEDILGLWWRKDKEIIVNSTRQPVSEDKLNDFPFVTDVYMRHLNIKNYF